MPQTDCLVVAIKAEQGIRSFDEFRRKAPKLKIAASPNDGINTVGYATQRLMELADLSHTKIESWSGSYIEVPTSSPPPKITSNRLAISWNKVKGVGTISTPVAFRA